MLIVKPETVVAWHRRGFRLFWTRKSHGRRGRPSVTPEIRVLIVPCRRRTDCGVRHGSMVNCSNSGLISLRPPLRSTWSAIGCPVADMAHVLSQPRGTAYGRGFLGGSDHEVPPLVRPRAPSPCSPTHRARRRHRLSDGGVDRSTAARSVPMEPGTPVFDSGSRPCSRRTDRNRAGEGYTRSAHRTPKGTRY